MDQQHQQPPHTDEKPSGHQQNHSPNLSYHRQRQMHQRHIQRIGGLHKLTADLAGIHFNEIEPQPPNLTQTTRARQAQVKQHPPNKQQTHNHHQHQQQHKPTQAQAQTQVQAPDTPDQIEMPKSDSGSQGSPDQVGSAIRDAEETHEDAAILKRYRICLLIGVGNYARVYKGIFLANNKELAIKSINLSKTSDNYRQKFLPRELSILKRVSHVNICKIYEILQVTNRIFIIMQYCARGTIADLLQRNQGPLNESVVRYLFAPTLDAVVYLHSLDIAHRDVKIENILLDHDYVPKLTDFSYSCWLSDTHLTPGSPLVHKTTKSSAPSHQQKSSSRRQHPLTMRLNDTFCGTLPYLSPEMIRQFPYDSRKTDVWSLGVCFYVMLNDRLPFPFNDIKLMVKRQLTRDYRFRSTVDVSDACRGLIGHLLDPDFSRRYTSMEASQHNWMIGARERPDR